MLDITVEELNDIKYKTIGIVIDGCIERLNELENSNCKFSPLNATIWLTEHKIVLINNIKNLDKEREGKQ